MISPRDLIECLRSMSEDDREEVAQLLRSRGPARSTNSADRGSGLQRHSAFMNGLTEEQKERLRRATLLGQ